jgi:hypothetical protein
MHKYGERKAIIDDPGWKGPAFSRCATCGWVAGRIETSRRKEVLSFTHHEVVAGFPKEEADSLLQWSIDTGASVAGLTQEINRRRTTPVTVRVYSPPRLEQYSILKVHLDPPRPELPSPARPLVLPAPQPPQREPPSIADTLSETPQPEQSSPATALAVLAQERRQREPDARWTIVISALEHALTIARSPEDRECFQDALNAAREVRANYLSR